MKIHDLAARFTGVLLTTVLLLACFVANTLGQTGKAKLTIDWIFGPEGRTVASVPTTTWLDDGTLVMLDTDREIHRVSFDSGMRERDAQILECDWE